MGARNLMAGGMNDTSRLSARTMRENIRILEKNPFFVFTFDCENFAFEGNYLVAVPQDNKTQLDVSIL
jgi:hypothetical protein